MKDSFKKVVDNVADLIDVKTVVTFAVIGVSCWGFVYDKIPSDAFIGITTAVVTYYFTRKTKE